jgi:two-component system, chemotaxis family, chemotaxis protein CheY
MSYRILVVDDSPVSRKMVCRAVAMCGLDVGEILEAGNGKEALELASKTWVDIVLADVNMPVMSGAEMVAEMAKRDFMSTTPVVIISSDRTEDRVKALRSMGISAYLPKPFRPEQVKQVISELLLGRKGQDHG